MQIWDGEELIKTVLRTNDKGGQEGHAAARIAVGRSSGHPGHQVILYGSSRVAAAAAALEDAPPLGSYEDWRRIIGGVLEKSGVEGFLGNQDGMYETLDPSEGQWEMFLLACCGVRRVSGGVLVRRAVRTRGAPQARR